MNFHVTVLSFLNYESKNRWSSILSTECMYHRNQKSRDYALLENNKVD